jgi:hypothetical protein
MENETNGKLADCYPEYQQKVRAVAKYLHVRQNGHFNHIVNNLLAPVRLFEGESLKGEDAKWYNQRLKDIDDYLSFVANDDKASIAEATSHEGFLGDAQHGAACKYVERLREHFRNSSSR